MVCAFFTFLFSPGSNLALTTAVGTILRDAGETKQEFGCQHGAEPLADFECPSYTATKETNFDPVEDTELML